MTTTGQPSTYQPGEIEAEILSAHLAIRHIQANLDNLERHAKRLNLARSPISRMLAAALDIEQELETVKSQHRIDSANT